jgi:hypothetical protein
MPLVSDIDIKCCLSRTAAAVADLQQVEGAAIYDGASAPAALTTGVESPRVGFTLPPGKYIFFAKGDFAMTGATSTLRSVTIQIGTDQDFVSSNTGATTTYTGTETLSVSGAYRLLSDTAISVNLQADFSAGTVTGGMSLQAVRVV